MIFFPLVGFLIGCLSWTCYEIIRSVLPENAACLIALVFLPIFFSGGLHADGFADFCDGFFGGSKREDILRIMKDSRIGAFGALGLLFLILLKFELLKVFAFKYSFFILAMTASRWAQVAFSFYLPYAGPEGGLGAATAGKVSLRELAGATLTLILVAASIGVSGFETLVVLLPLLAALGIFFKRKIGGVTGDLLGASSEMTELIVLITGICLTGKLR